MPNEMQEQWKSSWLDSGNQSYLDSQYENFLKDPGSVPLQWRNYFNSLTIAGSVQPDVSHAAIRELFKTISCQTKGSLHKLPATEHNVDEELRQIAIQKLIFAYRLLGHLYSNINPIAASPAPKIPELELSFYNLHTMDLESKVCVGDLAGAQQLTLKQLIIYLKKIYCGSVASEFMHINNSEERLWIQHNLEHTLLDLNFTAAEKTRILELVIATDGLEKYLGAKYPGAKRFSVEGCDSLIIGLDKIIYAAGADGVQEIVLAMAHRGRLNVLVNVLGKMPKELFDQFEEKQSREIESGDVKYHQGFASDLQTDGGPVHVSLAFNPSHLEIVTPVASGSVRARQERRDDSDRNKVLCVAMHGDAAFAGQGIVMEILNMSETRGYHIGGTIHIIINNQIGFTTSNPKDARSTMYCSDIGKMLSVPVFHVNADDPEAMAAISSLALAYRLKFRKDVIIDLVGYRRMGHNEADEPSATQPVMYKIIRAHPTLKEIYAAKIVDEKILTTQNIDDLVKDYRDTLDKRDQTVVKHLVDQEWHNAYSSDWSPYNARDWRWDSSTKVDLNILLQLATARDHIPDDFVLNSRVKKIVDDRIKMTNGALPIDWGYAETLAYATLLNEGYGVRLSGQDSGRGTFFHRHAVWHEYHNGDTYISLCHLSAKQGKFWVIDSLLSEAGVLGFEYGYSTSEPRTLTIWEAQFGDFANSAQVVIDQFISSGEQKWGRLSGLVMYLPHGYEGQGPEHSSARIERYLQLCAQHNIQVCIPTTPAQMFHMLRRQMLRPMRKPLITITPKSLLRHKEAISTLDELANGKFYPVIADCKENHDQYTRVVICAGKIYYELHAAMQANSLKAIAIIRIEQLYPFPELELAEEISKLTNAKNIVWCQEEPMNQGAWYSIQHHLRHSMLPEQNLIYAGRDASASPAVGYFSLHAEQQIKLVNQALGIN